MIVTRHAVERARARYGQDIRPADIRADAEAAVAAGREGIRPPKQIAHVKSRRSRREGTRYVWTADFKRVYLVKRGRDERSGYESVLTVVTAVQGIVVPVTGKAQA